MGYQRSRQQFRERVVRDSHRQADTGAVALATINRHTQDAYDELVTEWSSNPLSAIGKSHRSVVFTADSPVFDLPVEFLSLTGWSRLNTAGVRSTLPPQRVRQETALQNGWLDDATGTPCYPSQRDAYYIEGPGQEFDTGLSMLVKFGLRIRAFPPFLLGETITVTYKTQPLNLGDPAIIDAGVDLDLIEWLNATNFRAAAGLVRVRAAARGDVDEEQRAFAEMVQSARAAVDGLNTEDETGILPADSWQDGTLPVSGYGGGGGGHGGGGSW